MIGFRDIKVDNEGDLVIGANGDLALADTWHTTVQETVFRIRTFIGEYTPDTTLGSNIHSKFGEYNTRQNAEVIKSMVVRALSYDNRFDRMEYVVDIIPVSKTDVVIRLEFRGPFDDFDGTDYVIIFQFKYDTGDITIIGNGV